MVRRYLPLNPLRAFEAAARHLSFTRAAIELNVTHAAVSQQVRALEEQLGCVLFTRVSRGLVLTHEDAWGFVGMGLIIAAFLLARSPSWKSLRRPTPW